MSKQLDWDVFRYVLDDPSLDRAAFEQRMLEDESLAWAVADAVESIEQLRIASRFLDKQSLLSELAATEHPMVSGTVDANVSRAAGWHWSSLAALAAGLLLMIGGSAVSLLHWRAGLSRSAADPVALRPTTVSAQDLAESWLALNTPSDVDESALELLGEDLDGRWNSSDHNQASLDGNVDASADDHDWLMEAASLFYTEGAAS